MEQLRDEVQQKVAALNSQEVHLRQQIAGTFRL